MKLVKTTLLAILLISLLSACSSNTPDKIAKEWFEASATANGATALRLTCQQYKDEVQMSGFLTAGMGMLFGVDVQSAQVDMSGLKFRTTSESSNTAVVRVEGEMITSFLGAAMPQHLNMNLDMVKEDGDWKVCGGW